MGKEKEFKVKRYRHIYRHTKSSRRTVGKIIGWTILVAVLAFVGFASYQPLYDFITYNMEKQSSQSSSEPFSEDSSTSVEPLVLSSSSELQPQREPVNALFISAPTLLDDTAFEAMLALAKSAGANSVVLELKDDQGYLYYQTGVPLAEEAGVQIAGAVNLTDRIQRITEEGLTPIAQLTLFEDQLISRAKRDAAIKYRGSSWLWLDNTAENGGRAWLNPYSTITQDYLIQLAEEIAQAGCREIVLESAHFPTGGLREMEEFGTEAAEKSHQQVLREFFSRLQLRLERHDGTAILSVNAGEMLSVDEWLYGGNPVELLAENMGLLVNLSPAQWGDNALTVGSTVIEAPQTQPYEAVLAAAKAVWPMTGEHRVIASLQAYGGYGAGEIGQQKRAVTEAGIEEILLYSPDSVYPE